MRTPAGANDTWRATCRVSTQHFSRRFRDSTTAVRRVRRGSRREVVITNANPNFVETVFQGVARVGQPTILARPSSSNPAGDLIATAPPSGSLVSDFFAAGLVSAAVNQHYGNLNAAQIEYAPFGKRTGLCAGLATTAYQNEGLTLQPCSTPGTTVWIIDTADSPATAPLRFPIVSGSTTDFTHPFAMTIHGNPAHKRFPQIKVQRLRGNPDHVRVSQLWGANVSS